MEKPNLVWAKTLLSVYRYLERIAGAIDKLVLQCGLNSANIVGQNYVINNVYAVTDKMIALSQRKVTLVNVKVLVEDILAKISKGDAQILIEKFLDGEKTKALAEKNGFSLRTVFRKIDGALSSFSKALVRAGYTDQKLQNMLSGENWIKSVFLRFSQKDDVEYVLPNISAERVVSM